MTIPNLKMLYKFTSSLFDREDRAWKAAMIIQGILKARSPRITEVARAIPKPFFAGHKMIYRFLKRAPLKEALLRMFREDAPFVICDPTEIPRPQAKRTPYVGRLKDGKTRGFQLLVFSFPYKGRAIPFWFVVFSSRTISQEESSRNLVHLGAFLQVKELLGERPLVLDREFSYSWLLSRLKEAGIHFVVRLNTARHPTFTDKEGQKRRLSLAPGEEVFLSGLRYKGEVEVNVAGVWEPGHPEPLWIITDLDPKEALSIYRKRMAIEESFRDLKNLLGLERLMNKTQEYLEGMVALMLMAYGIGLVLGEVMREMVLWGSKSYRLYSGLFVLLRLKVRVDVREVVERALSLFPCSPASPVSSHV